MTTLDDAITWFDANVPSSLLLTFMVFSWLFSVVGDVFRRWFEGWRKRKATA